MHRARQELKTPEQCLSPLREVWAHYRLEKRKRNTIDFLDMIRFGSERVYAMEGDLYLRSLVVQRLSGTDERAAALRHAVQSRSVTHCIRETSALTANTHTHTDFGIFWSTVRHETRVSL